MFRSLILGLVTIEEADEDMDIETSNTVSTGNGNTENEVPDIVSTGNGNLDDEDEEGFTSPREYEYVPGEDDEEEEEEEETESVSSSLSGIMEMMGQTQREMKEVTAEGFDLLASKKRGYEDEGEYGDIEDDEDDDDASQKPQQKKSCLSK